MLASLSIFDQLKLRNKTRNRCSTGLNHQFTTINGRMWVCKDCGLGRTPDEFAGGVAVITVDPVLEAKPNPQLEAKTHQ